MFTGTLWGQECMTFPETFGLIPLFSYCAFWALGNVAQGWLPVTLTKTLFFPDLSFTTWNQGSHPFPLLLQGLCHPEQPSKCSTGQELIFGWDAERCFCSWVVAASSGLAQDHWSQQAWEAGLLQPYWCGSHRYKLQNFLTIFLCLSHSYFSG